MKAAKKIKALETTQLICGWRFAAALCVWGFVFLSAAPAQQLLKPEQYQAIRENASGELPYADFERIVQFPGFSPSPGADQVAEYLAAELRSSGLTGVTVEHFSADGEKYFYAFRSEPSWEVKKAQLWLEQPTRELLADYKVYKGSVARFSRSGSVSGDLIDVGAGTRAEDYAGRAVEGKIVLASGSASVVMRLAVWERKALGVVFYRTEDSIEHPGLISSLQIGPWEGPHGEKPTFAFSLSYREGKALQNRLIGGEHVALHADVDAQTGPGAYPEVMGTIPGTDPDLPVVLFTAHDNSRDSGGANNLTGVGCNLEIARLLSGLIQSGKLPRPRRTIRFMFGPEHMGLTYHFHDHPEDLARILAMINIDMIGYSQRQGGAAAVLHLYRSPYSNPSFIDDVVETFVQKVGTENTISIRNAAFLSTTPSIGFLDPIFAPTGTHDEFHYNVEPYWGPSDHEDAQTFGVRAILLNDYPDHFLGTQDDSIAAAGDPTQMRRGVVLGAAAGYALAMATAADMPAFLQSAWTKAEARLAGVQSRAFSSLGAATSESLPAAYSDAHILIQEAYASELTALQSLSLVADSKSFESDAAPFVSALQDAKQASLKFIEDYAQSRARQLGVSAEKLRPSEPDPQFAKAIPSRTAEIRGPVNIFRPEYGRWWLIDKTGDEHFERKLGIAERGEYTYYEALNLANGKRSVAEIRNVLSAEFEPIPAADVYQFFKFLEGVGVIRMERAK
jgi:aminopeptidase YwaD